MKSKQTKHKIGKIWSKTQKNKIDLDKKGNKYKNISRQGNEFTQFTTLYESDWTAMGINQEISAKQNIKALDSVPLAFVKKLNIPEYLLPYIDISVLLKNPHEKDSKAILKTIVSPNELDSKYEWESGNLWQFYNNGIKIYEGNILLRNPYYNILGFPLWSRTFSKSDAEKSSYYKKAWNVVVEYNKNGEKYKVTGVVTAFKTYTPTEYENPCSGGDHPLTLNFPNWQCQTMGTSLLSGINDKHEIFDITYGSINMRCLEGVFVFDGCDPGTGSPLYHGEYTDGKIISINWGSYWNIYIGGTKYKWVDEKWKKQGVWEYEFNQVDDITEMTFSHNEGYFITWDSKFNHNIQFKTDGQEEIDGQNYTKYTPDIQEPHLLEGASLRIKRNPEPYPELIEQKRTENIYTTESKQYIFKQSESSETIDKYCLSFYKDFFLIVKTSEDSEQEKRIVVYDDYWNFDGNNYIGTLKHTVKVRKYYTTHEGEILYKVVITLSNPLQYHEIQNYKK